MKERIVLALVVGIAASGCVVHNARGTPDDTAEPEGRAAEAEGEACELAPGIDPVRAAPAMPRVVAPDGVVVKAAEATVELAADGAVKVRWELTLSNGGGARAEALVGYAFRVHGGGDERPTDGVSFEGSVEAVRCSTMSAPEMHAVYRDETAYVVVPLEAGAEAKLSGAASFRFQRASSPMTILGQKDVFALNLKNFAWSYVKDPVYSEVAARVKPFHGSVELLAADSLRVTITAGGKPWLRAVSFEQNAVPVQKIGAHQLRFGPGEAPSAVEIEFDPELELGDEIAAFRKLAGAREADLRAAIHLADLLLFGGDAGERAKLLEKLLAAWDASAEAQLLTGRNDVRAAAYVALVRSLEAAGRSADARNRAAEGLEIAKSLDEKADVNRLAVSWLKKYLGEKAD